MISIEELVFNHDGLIPAIVTDFYTKDLLMMAYMNRQSLEITLTEQYTCFYSRSREQLWRKGETSGNRQRVIEITTDCDYDTLHIMVIKDGPACHTGSESCFFNRLFVDENEKSFNLKCLADIIADRKHNSKAGSYTNYLFDSGIEKILKKVGEENAEVIIAAMKGSKPETIYEIADLCYHLLVLMNEMDISIDDIMIELASRHKEK